MSRSDPLAWRPGHRRVPGKGGSLANTPKSYSRSAIAVGDIGPNRIIIQEFPPDVEGRFSDDEELAPGSDVVLRFSKSGYQKYSFGLTEYTVEELAELRKIINYALDMAEPVCKQRDEATAKKAEEDGEDRSYRSNRPTPRVSYFARQGGEHNQGVSS